MVSLKSHLHHYGLSLLPPLKTDIVTTDFTFTAKATKGTSPPLLSLFSIDRASQKPHLHHYHLSLLPLLEIDFVIGDFIASDKKKNMYFFVVY